MQLLEPVKALSDWQETVYYSTRVTVSNTCFWRSSWSSLWTVERTLPAYKDDLEHLEDMEPPAFWLELKQITDCNTKHWRRNYVDRGYVHCTPPSSGLVVLYPLYPPSQRCGLCQNFKKTTFIRFVQICTPLPLTKTFRRAWCQAKIWCSAWANVYTCGTVCLWHCHILLRVLNEYFLKSTLLKPNSATSWCVKQFPTDYLQNKR